jgi:hypothetical protein
LYGTAFLQYYFLFFGILGFVALGLGICAVGLDTDFTDWTRIFADFFIKKSIQ